MDDRRTNVRIERELQSVQTGGVQAGFSLARSGLLTASVLAGVLLLFGLAWRAHQRAQFHKLTTPLLPQIAPAATPGGQEAITLTRLLLHDETAPEFVSATLLPGIGMQVLQLAVAVPNHGTHNLLTGPAVTEAATMPVTAVATALFSLRISAAGHATRGEISAGDVAATDVIAGVGATEVVNRTQADGGEATGTFAVTDAAGRPSRVEAKVGAVLTERSFEVSVRLRNNALSSREFALSWSPHFAAPGGDLSRFVLSVPAGKVVAGGMKLPAEEFSAKTGNRLQNVDRDMTFVDLERQEIGEGPSVRLLDTESGLELRMVMLSPSIRSIRLRTDAAAHVLMLSFSTSEAGTGTVLQAGESAEWRVRMDLQTSPEDGVDPDTKTLR